MFAPYRTREEIIYVYNADMCRSFQMVYKEDKKTLGIDTIEFGVSANTFANSTYNSANEGFCRGDCIGNGVQNISLCYGGKLGKSIQFSWFLINHA